MDRHIIKGMMQVGTALALWVQVWSDCNLKGTGKQQHLKGTGKQQHLTLMIRHR
jgi:hypothetical protein